MIDQRLLPERLETLALRTSEEVAAAIRDMAIRGAPAIGAAAAYGLALAAVRSEAVDAHQLRSELWAAADLLRAARPTAANLSWALDRIMSAAAVTTAESAAELRAWVVSEAETIAREDEYANRHAGQLGAALLPHPATVIHHCNTGALATAGYGTALGVIRAAHESGKRVHVLVTETRPRLQGARLTTWELLELGVPHTLIADSAAGEFMRRGGVDAVLVGADRIAANGDTANKIGTYGLAVVAREDNVPFYVVAPTSTVDLALPSGDDIVIEERPAEELTTWAGTRLAPPGVRAVNPAFDITPHRYVTAFVTEGGVLRPPFWPALREAVSRGPVPAPQGSVGNARARNGET